MGCYCTFAIHFTSVEKLSKSSCGKRDFVCHEKCDLLGSVFFNLFDMGFFGTVSHLGGGGMKPPPPPPHHNFVIAPMIMKFGAGIKLDVFYTMVTEKV